MKEWSTVLYEQEDQVVTITLNRPDRRNALDYKLIEELDQAFKTADLDDGVRVIILAAKGPVFSAGHDISGPEPNLEGGGRPSDAPELETTWSGPERRLRREDYIYWKKSLDQRNLRTPTIAQVHGPCVAAGLMLACMCDLVTASEDAWFSNPVVRMGNGSTELLVEPWEWGPRLAKELLWTGDPLSAQDAWRLGMVNHVYPADELALQTMRLAKRIALTPPVAVSLVKRSINRMLELQGQLDSWEYHYMAHHLAHASDETRHIADEGKNAPGGLREYLKNRDQKYSEI